MTIGKLNLGQIKNAISIIGIVLFLIYFPVNSKFSAMEKEIESIKTIHKNDCGSLHEKMKSFANLDVTNIKLAQICRDLTRLFDDLDKCREQDDRLRDTIQELIARLSSE